MIEIKKCDSNGYNRVVEFDTWTVANLGYCEDTDLIRINSFQKHFETDEVFILLQGKAYLIILEDEVFSVDKLKFIELKPNYMYNVKKGAYHQHVLSKDANLIIVENQNTSDEFNSKRIFLNEDEIKKFYEKASRYINV